MPGHIGEHKSLYSKHISERRGSGGPANLRLLRAVRRQRKATLAPRRGKFPPILERRDDPHIGIPQPVPRPDPARRDAGRASCSRSCWLPCSSGLYLGARNIIISMIDRSDGDLWVMAYGTKNFEEAQPSACARNSRRCRPRVSPRPRRSSSPSPTGASRPAASTHRRDDRRRRRGRRPDAPGTSSRAMSPVSAPAMP